MNHVTLRDKLERIVAAPGTIQDSGLHVIDTWPKPVAPAVPEHLPDITSKAFLQAERNFPLEGHEEAAGLMYRRALETGLSIAYPSLKGRLVDKIKKLVEDNVLTKELGSWADQIRLIGNEGAHGEEVTNDDLQMARAFTDAVLRYVFTLPEQVKLRSKPQS